MTTLYPWNRPPRAQALFYGAVNMAVISAVMLLCAYGFVDETWPEMYYGLYATGTLFGLGSLAALLATASRAANEPVDPDEVQLALPIQSRRILMLESATPESATHGPTS